MKLFSRASEYAILALMRVLEEGRMERFSARDICAGLDIPEAFCKKGLVALSHAGILRGTPGPGGGYRIVKPLAEVSLLDIVVAVDGSLAFDECPLGVRSASGPGSFAGGVCEACSGTPSGSPSGLICPLHGIWGEARSLVMQRMSKVTLEDIRRRVCEAGLAAASLP